MSLRRMAYYCAVIGGWSAFFAWMICEYLFLSQGVEKTWQVVAAGAVVGAAIGGGLNVVAGMSNGGMYQTIIRLGPGLVGGGIGGAGGSLLGNILYASMGAPRFIGWIIMGLGIGVVEGLFERSPIKIRNGLIGGGLGGLAGGYLFDKLPDLMQAAGSGMSSRAIGFVLLGLCIGALIGMVQVGLCDAWLTVVDGYRVGRELMISAPVTILGRGDHLRLPFVGRSNADLESEHLAIERRDSGGFFLRDLSSKLGTFVNNTPVRGEVQLKDGDKIKLGMNIVRFNLTGRRNRADQQATSKDPVTPPPPPAPPVRTLPPAVKPAAPVQPVPGPVVTVQSNPISPAAPPKPAPPPPRPAPAPPSPPTAASPKPASPVAPPPKPAPAGSKLPPPPPPPKKN